MANPTKQQCSICGSPDHTHLHCYGMQAQGAISSNEKAPTHEYSPESGWQVFCPRCHCEIKTLKTAPHSEHECILALLAKVQSWEKSCTGRHGSQQPCVSGDSSAPETKAPRVDLLDSAIDTLRAIADMGKKAGSEAAMQWLAHHGIPREEGGYVPGRGFTQETYTNEAPSHPPILPERFNSVSLPEKASAPLCKCGRRSPHRFVEGECGEVKASAERCRSGHLYEGRLVQCCKDENHSGRHYNLTVDYHWGSENGKKDPL